MKKSLMIIFTMLMLISISSKAQQSKIEQKSGYVATLEPHTNQNFKFPEIENFDGSYQFIVKQKKEFLLTTETFKIIENKRSESEDVTISLNEFLDVYIISKQKVKQGTFVPFTASYILK